MDVMNGWMNELDEWERNRFCEEEEQKNEGIAF